MEDKNASGNNAAVENTATGAPPTKKAAKTQRPKPSHPPTAKMVTTAIRELKDRKGSSVQAIKKYIASTYKVDAEKFAPFIKKYLKVAVSSGAIVQTKGKGASGSFKLSITKPVPKNKKRASKKSDTPAKKTSEKKSSEKKTSEKKTSEKKTSEKKTSEKKIAGKKAPVTKKAAAAKKPAEKKSMVQKKTAKTTAAKKTEAAAKQKAAAQAKSMSKTKMATKAAAAKIKTPKPKTAKAASKSGKAAKR